MRVHPLLRLLAACTLLFSASAQAFGPHGHQTVGGIADQLLAGSPTAKSVRSLLGSNLQLAAVWADCAKGVGQVKAGAPLAYDGSGPYPECDYYENPASQAAMEAFVKRNAKSCYSNSSDESCRHKSYHYTDISPLREAYAPGLAGSSDHDIVHAVNACIRVLQGQDAPAPFNIRSKKEALRLLAHYLGDLHQPLHVVSAYLDPAGQPFDPDQPGLDPKRVAKASTKGGNLILDRSSKLHGLWDSIPGPLAVKLLAGEGASAARLLPATPGPLDGWAQSWASDTLQAGKPAWSALSFKAQTPDGRWPASHGPSYSRERSELQRAQIIKAGARLAELLRALLP